MKGSLPEEADERNRYPMADGLLDYFPNALACVAELSRIANDQHNPGEPMHWARHKSRDHANKIVRHLIDRGKRDSDGVLHSVKVAWRALAMAQEEIEGLEGAPIPRNAWTAKQDPAAPEAGSPDAEVDALLPPHPPTVRESD